MTKDKLYENDGEAQATQVGAEFVPGAEANAEIDRLLGVEAAVFGGKNMRRCSDDDQGLSWIDGMDYCKDDALTIELLDDRGVTVMVMESASKRTKVKTHIAAFTIGDELFVTEPFEQEAHAAACALWFVLSRSGQ